MENFPGEGVLYSGNCTGWGVSGSWKFQGGEAKMLIFQEHFTSKQIFQGYFDRNTGNSWAGGLFMRLEIPGEGDLFKGGPQPPGAA